MMNNEKMIEMMEFFEAYEMFKAMKNQTTVSAQTTTINTDARTTKPTDKKTKQYKHTKTDFTIPYATPKKIGKTYFLGFTEHLPKDVFEVIKFDISQCMLLDKELNDITNDVQPSDIITGVWNREQQGFEFRTKKAVETFTSIFKVVTAEDRNRVRDGWNKKRG